MQLEGIGLAGREKNLFVKEEKRLLFIKGGHTVVIWVMPSCICSPDALPIPTQLVSSSRGSLKCLKKEEINLLEGFLPLST